jgi:hypothetical protein
VTPDFEKLLPILVNAGVEFIVVDGVAAILHGSGTLRQSAAV